LAVVPEIAAPAVAVSDLEGLTLLAMLEAQRMQVPGLREEKHGILEHKENKARKIWKNQALFAWPSRFPTRQQGQQPKLLDKKAYRDEDWPFGTVPGAE
jgi:hypothetical protein